MNDKEPNSKTPMIDQLGLDLTAAARANPLDPVIGHKPEIERVLEILSRPTEKNPALVGEPGVGKSALVEELTRRLVAGEVPSTLVGKRLITLDIGLMVAGTRYKGEFEERLKKIIEEIHKSRDCILFIEELALLVGAGPNDGAVDAANILKPAVVRDEIQCIGTTTLEAYRHYIERDAALRDRFQEVIVREPTVEETIEILGGVRQRFWQHHHLSIPDEALKVAAEMASQFLSTRKLPSSAIGLIEEAARRVRSQNSLSQHHLKQARKRVEVVSGEKEAAIRQQAYELAAELRDCESQLRDWISQQESSWREEMAQIVMMWTGIPVMSIMQIEPVPPLPEGTLSAGASDAPSLDLGQGSTAPASP
ncbi:MAG TPA: AAA family ATPase [Ktedonosporobacter sp.]|nr:AAA family ATPase [Ktedonosporobacter sp.]